ncbi:MAG: trypsin-like peptidase domain-containing protein, partial [Xanthomonadales bacterium]|nr:trypsin-like peptidase domain-containing protein [Xanthomonadales bacterium]
RGNPLAGRIMGISPAGRPRHRVEQSLGSAVIVTSDGYMLTNHHVISAAVEIQAVLWDGRVIRAEIVGSDPDTDLAVLKIEGSNLPAISFSEEPQVRIGDVVLAIGNPFGIGQTVTMGIISATGRHGLNLSTYENLIQTDAAINFGNSGGALVDVEGRLIGINTAHYDDLALGAEGIGFAIPYQTARQVLDELIKQGFVTRGWLGLEVIPLELRNTLSGEIRPVLQIARVYSGGPAEQSGLRPGDLILRFADTDLFNPGQLSEIEATTAPGTTVQIGALRAGVPLLSSVTLTQRPALAQSP